MTEQPHKADSAHNWMGFEKATSGESKAARYWQGFEYLTLFQRRLLGWGAALLGLGIAVCCTFAIYIFEKANPLPAVLNNQGYNTNTYPNMALTLFLVLAGSLIASFGVAALAAALVSTRQAGHT